MYLKSKLPNSLHPNAIRGIHLFNEKKYFDAHEELELAWREETGWFREMYRGILQVGVAYYHIEHKNFIGARKMLERAAKWLEPYPDQCLGINIGKLKTDAFEVYIKLINSEFDKISIIDGNLFRNIETTFN